MNRYVLGLSGFAWLLFATIDWPDKTTVTVAHLEFMLAMALLTLAVAVKGKE